jgi:hypothetical protein
MLGEYPASPMVEFQNKFPLSLGRGEYFPDLQIAVWERVIGREEEVC